MLAFFILREAYREGASNLWNNLKIIGGKCFVHKIATFAILWDYLIQVPLSTFLRIENSVDDIVVSFLC